MTDITAYLAAAVFLAFGAYRLSAARGDATQRYIGAFALCMGGALVLNAPAAIAAVTRLWDTRAFVVALVHALKLGAFTCLALIALTLRRSPDDRAAVRRHIGAGITVQAVSAGLFAVCRVAVSQDAVAVRHDRRLPFAAYEVLFALYGMWCLIVLIAAICAHIRREEPGVVRTGLTLMALSAAAGALWTGWSAHDITAVLLTGRQGLGEDLPSACLGTAVALLAAAGASAPRWPVLLGVPLRWLRARRTHRALEPLWSALHSELPEIALAPDRAGRRGPRPATFALYRRVIEIRDAHLALRPYFDPLPPRPSAGRGERPEPDAESEAAAIAAALENRRLGRRPGSVAEDSGCAPIMTVPGTLEAEAAWLLRVTDAFVRCARQGDAAGRTAP